MIRFSITYCYFTMRMHFSSTTREIEEKRCPVSTVHCSSIWTRTLSLRKKEDKKELKTSVRVDIPLIRIELVILYMEWKKKQFSPFAGTSESKSFVTVKDTFHLNEI